MTLLRKIKVVGERAYVPLTQGFCAVIDACDFEKVAGYNWHVFHNKTNVYARRTERLPSGKRRTVQMHRVISECPDGKVVDHRDGNGLNNIRVNLRICDPVNNAQNCKTYRNNSTGVRGVQHYGAGRFRAQIRHEKKLLHLGVFDTLEEASASYEKAKAELHGEFRRPQVGAKPAGGLFYG